MATPEPPLAASGGSAARADAAGAFQLSIGGLLNLLRTDAAKVFAVCFIGLILSSADQFLFSYAITDLRAEFDVGLETIGGLLSLSFLAASFTVIAAGVLSDQFGRRRLFIVLLALSALFVGGHALATSFAALAALRVLGFMVGAGLYPIANTLVVETAPARYRGILAGFLQIGYPLGVALAAMIAALLIETHGWRAIFYPAFAVAVAAPFLGRLLPESPRFQKERKAQGARQSPPVGFRDLWRRGLRTRVLVCFCGSFLISLAIGGTTYFLPTYLHEHHGMGQAQAGAVVAGSYAIGALGYIAASSVGEFVLTRRNTLILWIWLGALAFAATLWLAEGTWALLLGLGLSILFMFGSEAVRMPMIGELFPTSVRATATSAAGSLAVTTAWLTAPLLMTYGAPRLGWTLTLTLFAVLPLLAGGAVFGLLVNLPSGLGIEQTSDAA